MLNIAIDGPGGSGKSTVAKALAQKLNILYLDTGAMYRACALFALKKGVSRFTEASVGKIIDGIDLKIEYVNGEQKTVLCGEDVSVKIRENEVSKLASEISALKCVRLKMVEMQRKTASEVDCVLDGRDIGTFVLPDAEYKFFMTASPEIRAERRYKELIARGQCVQFDTLLNEIIERDRNDAGREFAPLKRAADAVYLDTSDMTVDEVVSFIVKAVTK